MSEASFRLAYDEAVRALRAQADEHDSLRTRAGTILATSLVVSGYAARVRRHAEAARERERRTTALYAVSRALSAMEKQYAAGKK